MNSKENRMDRDVINNQSHDTKDEKEERREESTALHKSKQRGQGRTKTTTTMNTHGLLKKTGKRRMNL